MIRKMHLVSSIQKSLLKNVQQAQKKQCKVYGSRKGLSMFERFEGEKVKVKMQKHSKKKNLISSWEGP